MKRRGYSSRRNYINKCRRADRRASIMKQHSRSGSRTAVRHSEDSRNFSLLLLTAAAMLLSLLMIFGNKAKSESEDAGTYNGYYKYFTSITVQSGDTLSTYADIYNTAGIKSDEEYISEVCTINDIDKDHIVSGQKIIVPYYDKEFR
ncbi:MAG: LysM peptidoglycan-binding domain-containing protein [Oscillospiraceae bacterium]|nr:LysM peptidoglycan-binding domain-containing protein [Oscillospiraceae bacterium]